MEKICYQVPEMETVELKSPIVLQAGSPGTETGGGGGGGLGAPEFKGDIELNY